MNYQLSILSLEAIYSNLASVFYEFGYSLKYQTRPLRSPLMFRLSLILIATLLTGCVSTQASLSQRNGQITEAFFKVYAKRQDFEQLMAFYADNAVLEDMVYGHHAKNKQEIRAFLDWPNPQFSLAENQPALVVQQQYVVCRRP